ncbi:ubiquilin-3-like [Mus caroli]|uniref:Ubiquilin-like protein n=1 Tax=Mus caroli TaxID=10089 RepID=A0A6P5QA27_MUSCR|nr:ubiquilin-3-like [Mus caroli]
MARAREEAGDSQLVSGREPSSRIIRVSVKTPQDCQEFFLAENSNVRRFKKQISKYLHCNADRLVLIFTGKILQDQDILSQRGILDGSTVHVVVRSRLKGSACTGTLVGPTGQCTHRSEPSAKPGRLARTSPDLADFFSQRVQLLPAAPESVVQFLEDPLIQGLANEKQANGVHIPETSKMVQKRDPALKFPETLQKPAQQQEVLQEHKQRLEALKAVPGGDNAMHPSYSDIHQVMLSTLALLVASKGHISGLELCRGETNNAHSSSDPTTIPATSPLVRTLAQEVSTGGVSQVKGIVSSQASLGCRPGTLDLHSGSDIPCQESQQPVEKVPLTCQPRLSPCVLRLALTVLQQNLSLAHQLATGSPLLHHLPLLPILTNPRALQALLQIEEGLQILSREVPELGPLFRDSAKPRGARGAQETRGRRQAHREDTTQHSLAFLQLFHSLARACSHSSQTALPTSLFTEGQYQQELEELKALGFANRDANLQALVATDGDIHAAIEMLLGAPQD